jgi:MFS family permease
MDRNDRSIVGLVMVSHAIVHTYELTIPILMVIWLAEFPVTAATLGIVAAVGYGLFGLGALPSGVVSDRYGSQRMIALCLVGMGLSFVLLSFASSVVVIGVAIGLWGAAASIYHPAGLSLISTGVKDSGNGFAYHGMAGNVGIAFGPLVSVLLLWVLDWQQLALVLAAPAFVAVGFILKAEIDEVAASDLESDGSGRASGPTSAAHLLSASKALFLGGFALVFLVIIFNGLYYRGILTFLPELLADFVDLSELGLGGGAPGEQIGGSDFVYVGLLMVGIAGQYVGGQTIERVAVEKGLLVGYACLVAIALLFVPASEAGLFPVVAVSLLLGFFLFALQPIYQATVAEYSPAESRGLSYGFTYLGQFGVGALGAAVVGFILTFSTVGTLFLVLGLFAAVAAVFASGLLLWFGST